ncbi:MAG TPA: hypothetical protein VGN44_02075 [Candidatus Angelobacter sp.]|jgi:hypothetical protein
MEEATLLVEKSKYLNSWKEIAQYFGRGVRTVQRWEAMLGLPVRRPHGKSRSAVIAITGELDEWLTRAQLRSDLLDDELGKRERHQEPGRVNIRHRDRLFFVIVGGGTIKAPEIHG